MWSSMVLSTSALRGVRIFICAASEDRKYVDQICKHLAPAQRSGQLELWHKGAASGGTNLRAETAKHFDEMGRASAQSWDTMKHGFVNSYRDLQQSFDKAAASFKK